MAVLHIPGGSIKPEWEVKEIPAPPVLDLRGILQFAGPAVILGALSVGGFEAYNAGFVASLAFTHIYWVYIVSCFFQFFMNREVARYTMSTGETILQGFSRLKPRAFWAPFTALVCLVQQGWPAWIGGAMAAAAFVMGGIPQVYGMIGIGLVFVVFAASKYVYTTLEWIMYAAFIVANFGMVFMTLIMTRMDVVGTVTSGWFAFGVIPAGITFSLVGPFLNQPAGGFWNFWHTYWVREKGMGMGAYYGHLTGLITKEEEIHKTGFMFDVHDSAQMERFKGWMKLNSISLAVFFLIIGGILFTYFASLAGYSATTIYGMEAPSAQGISIVLAEIFRSAFGQVGFVLFAVVLMFTLFDSQFSVNDGIARMCAEAVHLESPKTLGKWSYRTWYFLVLGLITVVGMWAIWQTTPYFLWLILNWVGNLVHGWLTIMIVWLNVKILPKEIRPGPIPIALNLIWAAVTIGFFLAWTFIEGGPQFR